MWSGFSLAEILSFNHVLRQESDLGRYILRDGRGVNRICGGGVADVFVAHQTELDGGNDASDAGLRIIRQLQAENGLLDEDLLLRGDADAAGAGEHCR